MRESCQIGQGLGASLLTTVHYVTSTATMRHHSYRLCIVEGLLVIPISIPASEASSLLRRGREL